MNYIKISIGIFFALAASRFVPHPPNFTSLLALSFYVPVFLGRKFIPALVVSFAFTDLIIGFHTTTIFTWGSVIIIGFFSSFFLEGIIKRLSGALLGVFIFFIVTNFGVWVSGMYGFTIEGLILCYFMAIPFFAYNLISTFLFSSIIEIVLFLTKRNKFFSKNLY